MASGLRLLVEHAPSLAAVRRNLLVVSGLGFVLAFAKADASQFKFLEVRLSGEALFACIFGVCLYYLLMFLYRSVLMVIVWRADSRKEEAELARDIRERSQRTPTDQLKEYMENQRLIAAIENGPAARSIAWISIGFDFAAPIIFGLTTTIALTQRFLI